MAILIHVCVECGMTHSQTVNLKLGDIEMIGQPEGWDVDNEVCTECLELEKEEQAMAIKEMKEHAPIANR